MLPRMPASTSSRRAPAMTPDERRAQLEGAAIDVLRSKGLAATTKEIAEQAGVAEGTIFGVFDTKDDLVQAALIRAFDPKPLIEHLGQIDPEKPLRQRLLAIVAAYQEHLTELFGLMAAVGMVRPPESLRHHGHKAHGDAQSHVHDSMLALIEPDADRLRISPDELLRLLRMLTFAGSHKHIAHGDLLTPSQIVDVLLDGVLKHQTTTSTGTAATSC